MSLLMEALRKAEQAKNKGQDKANDAKDESLLQADDSLSAENPDINSVSPEEIETVDFNPDAPVTIEQSGSSTEEAAATESVSSEENTAGNQLDPEEVIAPHMALDEEDVARPYMEARESLLAPDEEESDIEDDLPITGRETAATASQPAEDDYQQASNAEVVTRRAANSMFQAKQDKSQADRKKMLLFLVLLSLFPVMGGTYWYMASSQDEMVFQGVDVNSYRNRSFDDYSQASQVTVAEPTPGSEVRTGSAPVQDLSLAELEQQAGSTGSTVVIGGDESPRIQPETASTTNVSAADPVAARTVSEPAIRLTRSVSTSNGSSEIQQAFSHYQQGELTLARAIYQEILTRDENNTAALTGLAAVYRQQGVTGAARDVYSRLLYLNPDDPVARAGLLETAANVDPLERENELKRLMQQHPEVAGIAFALGNLYASQSRWSEAQSAYFNAMAAAQSRQEMASPDYAFNLAVSLERLGQDALAYEYYQQAGQLSQQRSAGFTREILNQRVRYLEQKLQ